MAGKESNGGSGVEPTASDFKSISIGSLELEVYQSPELFALLSKHIKAQEEYNKKNNQADSKTLAALYELAELLLNLTPGESGTKYSYGLLADATRELHYTAKKEKGVSEDLLDFAKRMERVIVNKTTVQDKNGKDVGVATNNSFLKSGRAQLNAMFKLIGSNHNTQTVNNELTKAIYGLIEVMLLEKMKRRQTYAENMAVATTKTSAQLDERSTKSREQRNEVRNSVIGGHRSSVMAEVENRAKNGTSAFTSVAARNAKKQELYNDNEGKVKTKKELTKDNNEYKRETGLQAYMSDKGYDGLETRNKEGKFKTRKELDSEWSKGGKDRGIKSKEVDSTYDPNFHKYGLEDGVVAKAKGPKGQTGNAEKVIEAAPVAEDAGPIKGSFLEESKAIVAAGIKPNSTNSDIRGLRNTKNATVEARNRGNEDDVKASFEKAMGGEVNLHDEALAGTGNGLGDNSSIVRRTVDKEADGSEVDSKIYGELPEETVGQMEARYKKNPGKFIGGKGGKFKAAAEIPAEETDEATQARYKENPTKYISGGNEESSGGGEAQGVEGFVAQAIKDMGSHSVKGGDGDSTKGPCVDPCGFRGLLKEIIENLKDIIFVLGELYTKPSLGEGGGEAIAEPGQPAEETQEGAGEGSGAPVDGDNKAPSKASKKSLNKGGPEKSKYSLKDEAKKVIRHPIKSAKNAIRHPLKSTKAGLKFGFEALKQYDAHTAPAREKGWENKRKSKEAKASVKAKADKDKSEREAHLRTTSGYKEPKRVTNKERIEDWEGYSKKQRAHLGAKRNSLFKEGLGDALGRNSVPKPKYPVPKLSPELTKDKSFKRNLSIEKKKEGADKADSVVNGFKKILEASKMTKDNPISDLAKSMKKDQQDATKLRRKDDFKAFFKGNENKKGLGGRFSERIGLSENADGKKGFLGRTRDSAKGFLGRTRDSAKAKLGFGVEEENGYRKPGLLGKMQNSIMGVNEDGSEKQKGFVGTMFKHGKDALKNVFGGGEEEEVDEDGEEEDGEGKKKKKKGLFGKIGDFAKGILGVGGDEDGEEEDGEGKKKKKGRFGKLGDFAKGILGVGGDEDGEEEGEEGEGGGEGEEGEGKKKPIEGRGKKKKKGLFGKIGDFAKGILGLDDGGDASLLEDVNKKKGGKDSDEEGEGDGEDGDGKKKKGGDEKEEKKGPGIGSKLMKGVMGGLGMITGLLGKLVKGNPMLSAVLDLFSLAFTLFFLPIGMAIAEELLPIAIQLIDYALEFNDKFAVFWEWFKPILATVKEWLVGKLTPIFQDIVKALQAAWVIIEPLLRQLWEGIKVAWDWLGPFLSRMWEILQPLLVKLWEGIKAAWVILKPVLVKIGEYIKKLWDWAGPAIAKLVEFIKPILGTIGKVLGYIWELIKKLVGAIVGAKDTVKGIASAPANAANWVKGKLGFANGGYVAPSPGGTLIRVGEGTRGEHIIPEGGSMHGMGGEGTTINITFTGNVYGMNDFESQVTTIVNKVSNRANYR